MRWKSICCECEAFNRSKRYQHLEQYRERLRQEEWEEYRQQEVLRKAALRQVQEQQWQEREDWYRQQPARRCRACGELLPARAFGGTSSPEGFKLHTRCASCHAALCERHQHVCCLCQRRTTRQNFITHYDGYALCGSAAWLSLCCRACEAAFLALSESDRWDHIQSCCQRAFPPGQVVYAEVDPETDHRRYVGRTGRPQRRHAQHLEDASPIAGQWGPQHTAWYTRRNWMYELAEKGLTPSMQILKTVESAPLVLEWEQRYIWHGMQQGWPLLNVETMDEALAIRIRTSPMHFLEAPFEQLMQQGFFPPRDLTALLHLWYQPEEVAE